MYDNIPPELCCIAAGCSPGGWKREKNKVICNKISAFRLNKGWIDSGIWLGVH